VVGINSMIVNGFGMAVTTDAVRRFLEANDRRIGVTLQPVMVRADAAHAAGFMIVALEAGGAAHLSGLLIGDVILRANGEWLKSPEQLAQHIQAAASVLPLEVLREGRLQNCSVTINRETTEVA